MTIRSPKTEHHEGKDTRQIPIFPELRPYLEDAWEPEAEYVITRHRDANINLRTQLCRIIAKAGLTPWPKLFQNLRATRETELAETFPLHVVCEWIGNSQAVAKKHYLQVTDEHFAQATQGVAAKALQNALQQEPKIPCKAVQQECRNPEKSGLSRVSRGTGVGAAGPEQTPDFTGKKARPEPRRTGMRTAGGRRPRAGRDRRDVARSVGRRPPDGPLRCSPAPIDRQTETLDHCL